jgi:hypothetical protein
LLGKDYPILVNERKVFEGYATVRKEDGMMIRVYEEKIKYEEKKEE